MHLVPDSERPEGLDYEIWQGPAPQRHFNKSIVGGASPWLFDYGTSELAFDDKANQYVGREHRKGFELPDIT